MQALTTTRLGAGVSQAPFDRFNMGNCASPQGDDPDAVRENRRQLREMAALPSDPFWLRQVHGSDVVELERASQLSELPEADASFTRERGLVLAIQTADCLPVLLTDQQGTVVAGAHAGWRSLVGGVLEETVNAMDVDPVHLLAWLGPAAGPSEYEIGMDVYDAFVSSNWSLGAAFKTTRDHHWNVDLYAIARMKLETLGLRPDRISGGDRCTIRERDVFYSHRRDQRTGRMASLIWMAP